MTTATGHAQATDNHGLSSPALSEASWSAALDAFTVALRDQGLAESTVKSHRFRARRFLADHTSPWTLTAGQVEAWLTDQDWSERTRRAHRRVLHQLYAWAARVGLTTSPHPVPPRPRPRPAPQPRLPRRWVSEVAAFSAGLRAHQRPPATIRRYQFDLTNLARAFPDNPWSVSDADLAGWLDGQEVSAARRHAIEATVRHFYAWAVRTNRCAVSPARVRQRTSPAKNRLPPPPAEWVAALAPFADWLTASGRSPGTIRLYRAHLSGLARTNPDPWTVTGDDLAHWISSNQWKPSTRNSARSAARTFYKWAVRTRRIPAPSPADDLDPVRIPRAMPRPLPVEVVRDVLDRADDRDKLMMMLATYAGLRACEVARVHTDHIDGDTLRVIGKGGHERYVPLHPLLTDAIAAEVERRRRGFHGTGWRYHERIRPDGYLFPGMFADHVTAGDVTQRLSRLLGDGWTGHQARHLFATLAYAVDRDLRAVQELMGHSRPTTTALYVRTPPEALGRAVHGITIPGDDA